MLNDTITAHNNFLISGHRGACGYKPENTLSSFKTALDMNVDMIELDVYVCKTGELVVIHDDQVDRTTNGHGNVLDMTFDQLRNLVVEGIEQIPTLQEVIELLNGKVILNIELKGPDTAQSIAKLLQQYLKKGGSLPTLLFLHLILIKSKHFKNCLPKYSPALYFLRATIPKQSSNRLWPLTLAL